MKVLIFILLLTTIGCASSWSNKDKALYTGLILGHSIDVYQTDQIFKENSGLREMNPLIHNTNEAIVLKAGLISLVTWYADSHPEHRTVLLSFLNVLAWGTVTWNYNQ